MIRRDGFVTGFSMALGAAVLALFLLIGWRFLGAVVDIFTPFIVGTALALLLNPVVAKVQTRFTRGNRGRAVLYVFLTFLLVFIGLIAYLVPTVIGQTGNLIRFFAPLTYRVEQRVPGAAPKVVASDLPGSSYTVGNLRNGQNYTFRVVAVDAEGREYRLRPVRVTPSARQIVTANSSSTTPGTERSSTPASAPTPRLTATPTAQATPTPISSPSPVAGAQTRPSPRPTVSARDVALLPRSTVSPVVTPTPLASTTPAVNPTPSSEDFPSTEFGDTDVAGIPSSPSPEPSAFPLLVPGTSDTSEESPAGDGESTPAPTTEPEATPAAEQVTPSPAATPATPVAPPTPVAASTPRQSGGSSAQDAQNSREADQNRRAISLLETTTTVSVKPGTIVATPGNGRVRLNWRPPTNVQSGFERLRAKADNWLAGHRKIGFLTLPGSIAGLQSQYADQVSAWVQDFARRIASTIIGSLGILITIVLIPLVTFYVLSDMERLRGRLLFFLPQKARIEFVRVTSDVGEVFGNYIRGMATVSAIYGVVNFAVFLGLGLLFRHGLASYAILLGFVAGILYPVPYIGPTSTTLLAGIIAAATGHEIWQTITIVVLALVINQVFDNLLVPRLVGKSVGLHPMITLFALLLGGNLIGLWGMLLSVPVAASIQLILFRLFPRLAAPTPIAYLMPEKKPQPPGSGGTDGKPSYRDLLRTPDSVTEDKPSQAVADQASTDKTDATGNPPLGPVPTFRPCAAEAPERSGDASPSVANTITAAKTPPEPESERRSP